jgi:maltokinase
VTFEDMVAVWLPRQRWFSGSAATTLAITSDIPLAGGDPGLRHLLVAVSGTGGPVTYQVLLGLRSGSLPASVPPQAVIGRWRNETTVYDALHDPELAAMLLSGIAGGRQAGPLRFAREDGAPVHPGLPSWVIGAEQSNTSVVFGDAAILKVLRRPFPGPHPDLEITRALARQHSAHIAEPYGWIQTDLDGEPAVLAILSRFLPGATDGWAAASASLRDALTGPGSGAEAAASFAREARLLGAATADVHAGLAAAFGTSVLGPAELAAIGAEMTARLDRACAEVPELRRYAPRLREYYAALAELPAGVPAQRVHGDYHLGQVLRTASGWVILDFEGEPVTAIGLRRAHSPALRDVAGMLRSFDYAARYALLVQAGPGRPDPGRAREWVHRSQQAFSAGYAEAGGMDPAANDTLVRAFVLDKAVYEIVYESRHRPGWLAIPLGSLAGAA